MAKAPQKKYSDGDSKGECMNNPDSEKPMNVKHMLDEAMKDGAHVYKKMGMYPKK